MKKVFVSLALMLASFSAFAQFTVIRGVNPSSAFVNLNADTFGNVAVNCVIGCGASAGTGGLAANGAAVTGNPVLIAGYDGTLTRTLKTDTSGQANINVVNTPAVTVSGTATVSVSNTPAVTVSGTPNVSVTNTPAVTLASTTLSGTSNNVLISPSTNTLVDHSGSITTGGTAQTLSAAKSRKYFFFQNLSVSNMYLNFTSAASASTGSILIVPGGSYVQEGSFVSSELISVFGATTGQQFTAKDF
jgi:hypothetical protein